MQTVSLAKYRKGFVAFTVYGVETDEPAPGEAGTPPPPSLLKVLIKPESTPPRARRDLNRRWVWPSGHSRPQTGSRDTLKYIQV